MKNKFVMWLGSGYLIQVLKLQVFPVDLLRSDLTLGD